MAVNHWKLAVETHNTNFPDTDHDCADISATDPRRYPSTDLLIASPECTTHSPAGGSRRSTPQRDLFFAQKEDPSVVRSRATMFDVIRFAEYHRYRAIIVENVFEVTRWELFGDWLQMLGHLGYDTRVVCLNSMFAHPTPQSRDRIYVVAWRRGERAPDLDVRPAAYCLTCERNVEARQAWKRARTIGKYRQQYDYTCPACRGTVSPYYFAALNAIDFNLAAERIGDRKRPLRPRTMERVRFGLEKYGRRPIIVRTNMTTDSGRVRGMLDPHLAQTASWLDSIVSPPAFMVNGHLSRRVYGVEQPLGTQSASREHDALVVAPFLVETAYSQDPETRARGLERPMPAQSGQQSAALVSPFLLVNRTNVNARGVDDAIPTVATGGHMGIVQGAALLSLRDANAMHVGELTEPTMTQAGSPQSALISRAPFIVSYYGTNQASPLDQALPTLTVIDRHQLISPGAELLVEDCYFRMLQPHEIGAAMAFPGEYTVLGTKRDRVKQYGNAVTPPAMELLMRRVIAAITGDERVRGAA